MTEKKALRLAVQQLSVCNNQEARSSQAHAAVKRMQQPSD
jgi:hypothetical protein